MHDSFTQNREKTVERPRRPVRNARRERVGLRREWFRARRQGKCRHCFPGPDRRCVHVASLGRTDCRSQTLPDPAKLSNPQYYSIFDRAQISFCCIFFIKPWSTKIETTNLSELVSLLCRAFRWKSTFLNWMHLMKSCNMKAPTFAGRIGQSENNRSLVHFSHESNNWFSECTSNSGRPYNGTIKWHTLG